MYIPLSYLLVCLHTSAFASDVLIRGRNPDAALAKKAVCYSDNVLRALRANSASASPFCSSLIDIPGTTTFKSVAGVTATTVAVTSTRVSTITPNFPSPLPTYVSQYSTAQVSSACSCLSVPTSTETYTASTSTVYSYTTLYSTTTATGACATGTIYPGAHQVTGQFPSAYNFTLQSVSAYDCCHICNSEGIGGPYASCVAWSWQGGNCSSVLEGPPFSDYMKPPCTNYGLQPGTIYVDKAKYPAYLGGKGQCASQVTVVNG